MKNVFVSIVLWCSLVTAGRNFQGYEWYGDNVGSRKDLSQQFIQEMISSHPENSDFVKRVDLYTTAPKPFYWAWHSGSCNGLADANWIKSDGGAFGRMVNSEVTRLKKIGILKNGGVAIDIGAHTGDSTIPMAILADQTIAFDPSLSTYPILHFNSLLNSNLHIESHNIGVAAEDGELEFEYGKNWECNGGVTSVGTNNHIEKRVMRPTVQLHSFLNKTYGMDIIKKIAYIKIDCEGFDGTILNSIRGLIEILPIKPILQVEYFQPFRLKDLENDGMLTLDSLHLIEAIEKLPGGYRLYCTKQCNTENQCNVELHEVHVRRNDGAVHLWNTHRQEKAFCDDFILLPSKQ